MVALIPRRAGLYPLTNSNEKELVRDPLNIFAKYIALNKGVESDATENSC